ncbi:MAG: lipid-A-disaccharide synthase [Gammaproteobacteria bacterium]|nr:lipid-A-disaccharide synthase [Gammaproteobacteria bacterium]
MKQAHVMILAGEASGDAHAAEFVEQLKLQQPQLKLSGMGGKAMQKAGVDVFFDSSIIAVVGLVEVLRHWGDIKRAMDMVKQRLDQTRPDLLILVDYPEFNLKMARHARELGIKVLFYISPQVWAWRPKRIHKIGSLIDHMAVIFKFEKQYYEKAGIPVSFVGHPLVDKVKADIDARKIRMQMGISPEQRVVGLFPGSRTSEISRLLPLMFATARQMQAREPRLKFLLPVASSLDFDELSERCSNSGLDIIVTRDEIYDVISCCDAIASCSGTVTLEIALHNVPMCILYKMSWLSYLIMSRLITIPHIGLANIVADKAVVKEFLQQDANPDAVSRELFELLENQAYRDQVKQGLKQVRDNLGSGDGARSMAKLVLSLLDQQTT